AAGVVSTLALDDRPTSGAPNTPGGLIATAALVSELAEAAPVPVWSLTHAAVDACGHPISGYGAAGVWGLGLVAALEQPRVWGGLVDLDEPSRAAVERALDTILDGTQDQVAVRGTTLLARRLVHADPPTAGAGTVDAEAWRPKGTVLVTGATGGLAAHLVPW